MPDYSDCYGGRFVKAADITKPFNGTIERAERTEVEKGRPKVVVYFEGRDKGFVLNATRFAFLCELAKSKDTDDWPGLTVGVSRGRVNFAGKMVDAIVFGAPAAKKKAAAEIAAEVADELNDAITF